MPILFVIMIVEFSSGVFSFQFCSKKVCKDRQFFIEMQKICSKNMFYDMILSNKPQNIFFRIKKILSLCPPIVKSKTINLILTLKFFIDLLWIF